VVQALHPEKADLFKTFGLDVNYNIDLSKLDSAYKELQKLLHPDKFATKGTEEKQKSTSSSSAVNFAYEVSLFKMLCE
jgi:molecular chaperone HscB